MRIVAVLLAAALVFAGCGDPSQEAGATGIGDEPVSSTPDRPSPDDLPTIPPTDQCPPGAEVSEGEGGDALHHERCPATDYDKKYELVEPRPGMVDVNPVQWAGVKTSDDGRTLTVRYWSGVEPCSVLDHVDVDYEDDAVVVTLYEGREPTAGDVACIEMAVLKAVRVVLDSPVGGRTIEDGAKRA
jgi:hypothetical protein